MNRWITINLRSGGLENTGLDPFGQAQHIQGSHNIGLDGFDRVELIVDRRGRTGQVINLIDFQSDGVDEVMSDDFKMRIIPEVQDIFFGSGKKIIDANHIMSPAQ